MRPTICLVSLILLLAISQVAAQTQEAKISFEASDLDIAQALSQLSQKAGISILGDSTVKGKVNCRLNDMTAEQALGTICKMNKLVWVKVYAGGGTTERPAASKLFKLLDELKKLGAAALICEDPSAETQTVFIPNSTPDSVKTSDLASALKLKPVYLVRAEPDPEAEKKAAEQKLVQQALPTPSTDTTMAATQVWNYFNQMPLEQRFQVMHELRQMVYDNLTPEQREAMRGSWGGRDGRGRDGGRDGRRDGQPGQ